MGTEILVRGITFIKLGAVCVDEDLIIHFNATLWAIWLQGLWILGEKLQINHKSPWRLKALDIS